MPPLLLSLRDGMRLESELGGNKRLRAIGDLPYYATPVIPIILDPLIAAWIARGDANAAVNLQLVGCKVDSQAFRSAHTTTAATSAGIVCANHRAMPLWGHPAADAGASALATTGPVLNGVSRSAADRHYSKDVIARFGIGFGLAYGVPTLLHYAGDGKGARPDVSLSVSPGAPCTGACLKLAGSF